MLVAHRLFYALLSFGALGILYPMLLVFGQSMSNAYDLRDNALMPHYFFDRNDLALKHVFSLSPQKLHLLASRHRQPGWQSQNMMRATGDYFASRPTAFAAQGLNLAAL